MLADFEEGAAFGEPNADCIGNIAVVGEFGAPAANWAKDVWYTGAAGSFGDERVSHAIILQDLARSESKPQLSS